MGEGKVRWTNWVGGFRSLVSGFLCDSAGSCGSRDSLTTESHRVTQKVSMAGSRDAPTRPRRGVISDSQVVEDPWFYGKVRRHGMGEARVPEPVTNLWLGFLCD